MSDATLTTPPPQRRTDPFRGWELPTPAPGGTGKRAPDECAEADELAAVAVLSTN